MANLCSNICLSSGINAICDTGMGGIVDVAVTNWASGIFTKQKETEQSTNYTYVTALVEGGMCGEESPGWLKYSFKRNTGVMTSTATVDDANGVNFVQTDLSLVFSHMEKEKREAIMEVMKAPSAVVVHDANDKYWALGLEEPVTVSASEGTTGTARTDANQYTLTLTDISDEFPFPVSNGADIMAAAVY